MTTPAADQYPSATKGLFAPRIRRKDWEIRTPFFSSIAGSAELPRAAVAALEGRKVCLLAHHGLLAFVRDLAKAMWLAGEVETLAQQTVMCLQLGGPKVLPVAEIEVGKFNR